MSVSSILVAITHFNNGYFCMYILHVTHSNHLGFLIGSMKFSPKTGFTQEMYQTILLLALNLVLCTFTE